MSDPSRAVFLSYASQDAEAAKRICDALRAAGVEVWFDQSELVGGDAWDAKIRKNIKECELLIPIISANTQARTEGYFRLEWRLADQRTHLMAKGRPFLLPVVIDGTRDSEAQVPDSFMEVQWTKLPGGETTPAFVARVNKLLRGEAKLRSWEVKEIEAKPRLPLAGSRWLRPTLAGLAIVIGVLAFTVKKSFDPQTARARPDLALGADPAASASAPTLTEAQQLVAKAWAQLTKADLGRSELEVAGEFCKQAAALAPTDADVWAVWSQVDSWTIYHGFDDSRVRRESARSKTERAMQLAPRAFESRLARACYLIRGRSTRGLTEPAPEAEPILRELLRERPGEPRALFALGILQRDAKRPAEMRATFDELARNPAYAAVAWNELGWAALIAGDSVAAEAAADKSIAFQPYTANLCLKLQLVLYLRGDLEAAAGALAQLPGSALQEDYGAMLAMWTYFYRREWDKVVQALSHIPREWLDSAAGAGPRSAFLAWAYQSAGRDALAEVEWRNALKVVEQRLAETPNDAGALEWKGMILASQGDRVGGEKFMRLGRELRGYDSPRHEAFAHLLLGEWEQAIIAYERALTSGQVSWDLTAASFRLYALYDPLRKLPGFEKLVDHAQAREAGAVRLSPPAVRPDDRSVAVLAFANLSDDKDNEYFADGVSEELLNALAKIPNLKVSARTSAFSFKGKNTPVPEIARQLGVAYVVEGSVRKQGDKVRITAQLIKAADGFHVWSNTFTRDLKDIFAVQDEIAGLIAQNLSLKLGMTSPAAGRAVDPEAYRLMLAGRDLIYDGRWANLKEGRRYLEEAIARDEKFALAWAWLSITHWGLAANGWVPFDSGFQSARTAAEKALALQPDLPQAHTASGLVYYGYDWDWARARTAFERALVLAPGDAPVVSNLTRLAITLGKNDEAVRLARQAVALDPLSSYAQYVLSVALLQAGRYEELEKQVMEFKAVSQQPAKQQVFALILRGKNEAALKIAEEFKQDNNRTFVLALAHWACGHRAEADENLARLKAEQADTGAYQIAELHAFRGEKDEAFAWLETSYRQRDTGMIYVKNDPWFKTLHADPRWPVLLRKMNLADPESS